MVQAFICSALNLKLVTDNTESFSQEGPGMGFQPSRNELADNKGLGKQRCRRFQEESRQAPEYYTGREGPEGQQERHHQQKV